MSRAKVFVTREIPAAGLDMLKERYDVEVNPYDRPLTKEEIIAGVKGKDALLPLLTDIIDAEVMDANPNLKIIADYAVGYNNIDIEEATKRGIPVSNTPGVLTETTADLAWLLMMAVARRLGECERYLRTKEFKGWGPMFLLGTDVYGKTLGIIGMGRIGKAMAKRAKGFDMRVIYYNSSGAISEEEEKRLEAMYYPLEDLLKEADFVSLHVPLTKGTRHLIGEKELELMKETAYIINTARGPVIDEKALIAALKEKKIAGAGLDVFENEPLVPKELLQMENVVLAPHVGSATLETRSRMAVMAAQNIIAALNGEEIPNLVNKEVLK
ncbi:MAG: glyoxylate reductase [Clostridia bacterium]|jgi:glyoxylate reductase|nr:glyoxylate reductase [Clostridiales bacterium]MDK2984543.1 glyoxylate reductase [Clostridia bacterium]